MEEEWEPHWSSTFQRHYLRLWSPRTNAVEWEVTEEMVRDAEDGLKTKKRQRVR